MGRALRVGQLPLEDLAQRQADRQEPRRLPALRDPPAGRPAQARRRQPPGHPRRLAAQADRLPALGPVGRAARRPAAGGTTAACCARSTCARSTTSTSTRSSSGPICPARRARRRSTYRVTLRNYGSHAAARERQRAVRQPRPCAIGTAAIGAKRFATLTKQIKIDKPRLWSPASPYLYDASMAVRSGGSLLQRYTLKTGIRSIKVVDGHLFLNGAPMNFRGVALHEDSRTMGFAIDNKTRDQQLAWVKELGATVIRSHYPLRAVHPGARRRARDHAVVGDPGLRGQDAVPQADARARSWRPASSSRTSRPTATTRRSSSGRSATS